MAAISVPRGNILSLSSHLRVCAPMRVTHNLRLLPQRNFLRISAAIMDSLQDKSTGSEMVLHADISSNPLPIPPNESTGSEFTSIVSVSAILVFILKGLGSVALKDLYASSKKWVLNGVARNFPGQKPLLKKTSIPRQFKRGLVVSVGLGSVEPDHLCIATLFRKISFGSFTKKFPLLHSFGVNCVKPGKTVVFPKDVGTILEPNGPYCPEYVLLKEDEILGMLSSDNIEDILPLKDRILLKLPERVSDTIGGHFAHHSIGTVVAVGSGPIDAKGHRKVLPFSRGNSVIYSSDGPKEYKDSKYVVVKAEDIVLVRLN